MYKTLSFVARKLVLQMSVEKEKFAKHFKKLKD